MLRIIGFLIVFCLIYTTATTFVGAQSALNQEAIELFVQQRVPEPFETTQISLEPFSIRSQAAAIRWFANNVELSEFRDQAEIAYIAGDFGETTTMRAVVTLVGGTQISAETTFTPARVDVIFEAQTFTPHLYQGAALPSNRSTVRVVALPQEATFKNPEAYTYSWRLNNRPIPTTNIISNYITSFTVPYGRNTLSVEVFSQTGQLVARKNIAVPVVDQMLNFYADNPLRGMSEYAIDRTYNLLDSEVTLRAEPFFINKNILDREHIAEWEIANNVVSNNSDDPFEISLRRQAAGGQVKINFHIRDIEEIAQGVQGNMFVTY